MAAVLCHKEDNSMKMTKRMIGILLACAMLMCAMPLAVSAAGTQDNPINANDKWFGYGVDCFLLNTTLAANDTDGVWYRLTADTAGILQLEHSSMATEETPAPDYRVTAVVNGTEYVAYSNGVYYKPITTYPLAVGDVVDIHVIAQDTTQGGTIYLNAKFISGDGSTDINQMVKVKSAPAKLYVAAGATVYYQDDSLQAAYATQYVELAGDSVADVTLYTAAANGVGTVGKQTAFNDTDEDNIIEGKLGGSLGSAGAPAVKPAWAITNNSGEDRCFILKVVSSAHECNWDNNADTDCNTCGTIRQPNIPPACEHQYNYDCDTTCSLCGEVTRPDAQHAYAHDFDAYCDYCDLFRAVSDPMGIQGSSIREEGVGMAVGFYMQTNGMEKDGYNAIYDNATVNGYKLVTMGAIVSNKMKSADEKLTMDMVDGSRVLNITANYLYDLIPQAGVAFFKVSINNIPEKHKDTCIGFQPYFVLEDASGQQHVVYSDKTFYDSYNAIANR